jgi:predicted Rossmann-fold nucleotide-binding protein
LIQMSDRDLTVIAKAMEPGLTDVDDRATRPQSNLSLTSLASRQNAESPGDPPASHMEGSALSRLWQASEDSFKSTLIQSPTTAVAQVADHVDGGNREDRWSVYKSTNPNPEFGTAEWLGHVAGSVVATGLELGLLYRFVGPGAAAKFERSASYGSLDVTHLTKGLVGSTIKETGLHRLMPPDLARDMSETRLFNTALPSLSKSMATGLVVGGVLTPNSEHSQNFGSERLTNALFGGLGFTTQTALAMKLKTLGSSVLRGDIISNTLAAGASGEVEVDGRSLVKNGRLASGEERFQTLASSLLGGALGGSFNAAHEYVMPTTGVRGIRTLADAKDFADSTRVVDFEKLHGATKLEPKPPRADDLMHEDNLTWDQRALVGFRKEMDNSQLPEWVRKDLVRDLQAAMHAAQAVHGDGANHQKIITVWGGVRVPADDFDYQIIRAFGGLAARQNWAIQTGGARKPVPEGGSIMEAANKGANEAGGRSIGIVVTKLEREKTTSNPFINEVHWHPNFGTRLYQLRMADEHVLGTGGIGSVHEFFDKSVHQQVGKEPDGPIYSTSPHIYKQTQKQLKVMERYGLVNQADVDRLTFMPDPRDIIKDIARRDQIKAAQKPPAADVVTPVTVAPDAPVAQ